MMATLEGRVAGDRGVIEEIAELYAEHHVGMVRLATVLVGDPRTAEECVQDAFVRMFESWGRIRDPSRRVAYLRSAVLNGARNQRRSGSRGLRGIAGRSDPDPSEFAVLNDRQRRLLGEVARLPARQRECLVLRFYCDLSEAEIAETLGISTGSVKTHTHRGLRTLEHRVEELR